MNQDDLTFRAEWRLTARMEIKLESFLCHNEWRNEHFSKWMGGAALSTFGSLSPIIQTISSVDQSYRVQLMSDFPPGHSLPSGIERITPILNFHLPSIPFLLFSEIRLLDSCTALSSLLNDVLIEETWKCLAVALMNGDVHRFFSSSEIHSKWMLSRLSYLTRSSTLMNQLFSLQRKVLSK